MGQWINDFLGFSRNNNRNFVMGAGWQPLEGLIPSTQAFGTVTTQSFFYRQEGESARIRGYFLTGTAAGAGAFIQLPNNLPISTRSSGTRDGSVYLGTAIIATASGTPTGSYSAAGNPLIAYSFVNRYDERFNIYLTDQVANAVFHPRNGNNICPSASGDMISLDILVPIEGWETSR